LGLSKSTIYRGVFALVALVALALAIQGAGCPRVRSLPSSPAPPMADPPAPRPIDGVEYGPLDARERPRIVALSPGIADIVRELGGEKLLVGRHAFDRWSDQSLAICGDQVGFDYEALLRVKPNVVLVQWGVRELPERLLELGKANGWRVVNVPLLTLEDIDLAAVRVWQDLVLPALNGDALVANPQSDGPRWPGRPIGFFVRGFDAQSDPHASKFEQTVLLLYSSDPPTALGPGSYHHDILLRLAGKSAIETGGPFMKLDAEDVIRLAPEAIVLIQPRDAGKPAHASPMDAASLRERLGVLGKLDIPAIKNGRVALIDDEMALIPGLNLQRVGERMREILRAWSTESAR
jgi:ABC-type Fe3+-hydroxamate transport system substrate-binding protein